MYIFRSFKLFKTSKNLYWFLKRCQIDGFIKISLVFCRTKFKVFTELHAKFHISVLPSALFFNSTIMLDSTGSSQQGHQQSGNTHQHVRSCSTPRKICWGEQSIHISTQGWPRESQFLQGLPVKTCRLQKDRREFQKFDCSTLTLV